MLKQCYVWFGQSALWLNYSGFVILQLVLNNGIDMQKPEITKDIYIEDLVHHYPFSVRYLSQKGVKCIACGEPVWGTLEEAAQEKNFTDAQIIDLVKEMKKIAKEESGS